MDPGGPGEGTAGYFISLTFCMRELEKVMVTSACCYVKIDAVSILNKAAEKVGQATSCPDCHRVQGKGGSGYAGDPSPPCSGVGTGSVRPGPEPTQGKVASLKAKNHHRGCVSSKEPLG